MNARPDPDFELIVHDPLRSFRWHRDDYPNVIARWNYHPEFEIHLITESTGKMLVGDHIGPFAPGNFVLVGPNLPHNWVSDVAPGQLIEGRDIVLQFPASLIADVQKGFPEFAEAIPLLEQSRHGIEILGSDARECGELIEKMGVSEGLARVANFVTLIERMTGAKEKRILASKSYSPDLIAGTDDGINRILDYIFSNIHDARMSVAARIVEMNQSTFSRHFKNMTGNNFVDCVRKIRIARACTLLDNSDLSVTDVCFECGFLNISYFNRNFRREKGMTPREYRSYAKLRRPGFSTR